MSYMAIFDQLRELVPEIFGAVCVLFAGWFWGRWRSQLAWSRKQFKDRITFSLNCLDYDEKPGKEGETQLHTKLRLRTLFESDLFDVFHNGSMVSLIHKAITRVEKGSPLLDFEKDDAWHLLNTVLNQIAERFATGVVKKDMGVDVASKWYTFCLTYELEDEVRTNKTRVMIIEKEKFAKFPEEGEVDVASAHHQTRVKTLRYLKREQKTRPYLFMDIELVI